MFVFFFLCVFAEEQEKPADLSQRVVFKKPKKAKSATEEGELENDCKEKNSKSSDKKDRKQGAKEKPSSSKQSAGKLSFEDEDEEEDF